MNTIPRFWNVTILSTGQQGFIRKKYANNVDVFIFPIWRKPHQSSLLLLPYRDISQNCMYRRSSWPVACQLPTRHSGPHGYFTEPHGAPFFFEVDQPKVRTCPDCDPPKSRCGKHTWNYYSFCDQMRGKVCWSVDRIKGKIRAQGFGDKVDDKCNRPYPYTILEPWPRRTLNWYCSRKEEHRGKHSAKVFKERVHY